MSNWDDAQRHPRDPVMHYFVERGVSAGVRSRGLRGIIAEWAAIAHNAASYDLTLDDWLNDVDLRDIIEGALAVAPERERKELSAVLARSDDVFRAATVPSVRSLCAQAKESATKYDPSRQWWYFRYPAHPGKTMSADLTTAGFEVRS